MGPFFLEQTMITEYTSFEDVRAALGVSDEEIDDSTLSLDLYSLQLDLAFYDISPLLLATYEALPAAAVRTVDQKRFAGLVGLFSTVSVAWDVYITAEMFGYQKVADGRASTERTETAYANLGLNLAAKLTRFRGMLLAALQILVPEVPTPVRAFPSLISGVGLALDPVTG